MDELFAAYSALLEGVSTWVDEKFPAAEGESPAAHRRAVRAKALDLVRGVLPAASLSHVGIYATGQTYEQLVLHLRSRIRWPRRARTARCCSRSSRR